MFLLRVLGRVLCKNHDKRNRISTLFITFAKSDCPFDMSILARLNQLQESLPQGVTLVAVSKTYPVEALREAYEAGQRDFGENRVQELVEKAPQMPSDVRWHLIGNLQRNKVKQALPHVTMIHSVSSLRLLDKIELEAANIEKITPCLMQIHIAQEDSKSGLPPDEAKKLFESGQLTKYKWAKIVGLMGMATLTSDETQIAHEFQLLQDLFNHIKDQKLAPNDDFHHLSMGMSGDYKIALEKGSSIIRVGSLIFGKRD